MRVAGRYRTVCRNDHAVPENPPRPLTGRDASLDIRIWSAPAGGTPLLLVNASRKQGYAVQRNRFRRRVRMAFLDLLKADPRLADFAGVVWVRPARGNPKKCMVSYQEIEGQLRLAFSRWETR
jgi:ribonuclease P protein component